MEVRHNTDALERALQHIVRKASIPLIVAESSAMAMTARAQAFRRLATGGALAIAAIGIGIGIWLASDSLWNATQPVNDAKVSSGSPSASSGQPPETRPSVPQVAEPSPETVNSTEDVITTDYSIFRNRTVQLAGREWEISAGHQFDSELDKVWRRAWCYTIVDAGGVTIRLELVTRESPSAPPVAPQATEQTLKQAQISDLEALTLSAKCPWLDQKEYALADFVPSSGRRNPFNEQSATFSLAGRVLSFSGPIGENFIGQLQAREFDMLNVDSPGGLVDVAMAAGQWLRATGKQVNVVGDCLSACVLLLAGGVNRTAEATSHIGVHRFYSLGAPTGADTENAQILSSAILRYLKEMGVSDDLFHAMSTTPSSDMLYLDRNKLIVWGLLQPLDVSSGDIAEVIFGIKRYDRTDIPGGDYKTLKNMTVDECESACSKEDQCRAFTYNINARWCFLKRSVASVNMSTGAVSGVKAVQLP